MDISWNLTFWIILEVLHSWQSQNFHVLDNWKNLHFLHLNHSRTFILWTIPEVLPSGPFYNFDILDCSRVLHSWPFQNVYLLDHSRIFTFWTIPEFLHSGAFNHIIFLFFFFIFRTIQEFIQPGPLGWTNTIEKWAGR